MERCNVDFVDPKFPTIFSLRKQKHFWPKSFPSTKSSRNTVSKVKDFCILQRLERVLQKLLQTLRLRIRNVYTNVRMLVLCISKRFEIKWEDTLGSDSKR